MQPTSLASGESQAYVYLRDIDWTRLWTGVVHTASFVRCAREKANMQSQAPQLATVAHKRRRSRRRPAFVTTGIAILLFIITHFDHLFPLTALGGLCRPLRNVACTANASRPHHACRCLCSATEAWLWSPRLWDPQCQNDLRSLPQDTGGGSLLLTSPWSSGTSGWYPEKESQRTVDVGDCGFESLRCAK